MTGRAVEASLLVDARALHLGGIGRYLREILPRILVSPVFRRIVLLGNRDELRAFAARHPSAAKLEIVPHVGSLYSLRSQASWVRARMLGRAGASVAFFPHWDAPLALAPARSVVTVHDLIHFRVPDAFPGWRRPAAGALLRRVVSRATRVIVDSTWTGQDLLAFAPAVRDKRRVVPLGVSEAFRPVVEEHVRLPVREPFLLCLGNKKRHKNLAAAVDVLARLLPSYPDLQLVVAGQPYAGWNDVLARATELGVRAQTLDLPVVSDAELRVLYGRCAAFLFPSRYEGFGLPVLEAMACGAPVVASNASSVPEVAGDAAALFAPEDVAGMAAAVSRLLTEPVYRAALLRKGRERASAFSWDRTAQGTIGVLQEAAAT